MTRHNGHEQKGGETAQKAENHASHAQNICVSVRAVGCRLLGIDVIAGIVRVYSDYHIILIILVGIPELQKPGRVVGDCGKVAVYLHCAALDVQIFSHIPHLLYGHVLHIGVECLHPLVAGIADAEIKVGAPLHVVIIGLIIVAQLI